MVLRKSRLTSSTSELFNKFNASISYDQNLFDYDILGSLAHVNMLSKCKIISEEDAKTIQQGLLRVKADCESNKAEFTEDLEDIHMNVEKLLTDTIGELGKKVHTARSRNDQVALDEKLYLREVIVETVDLLLNLVKTITKLSEKNSNTILPGYTHLQKAQPILLSHHLLSYAWMFTRDIQRFFDTFTRINFCPLGAGAIAGSGFAIDREHIAKLLNFEAPTQNSIDTVSDRDHILEYLSNAAICFSHLSRFSEELIVWSSQEFSFVNLPDEFCTTSSMMPQKKNPDLSELIRGKTGRVYGNLISLLTTIKGLSLAYFKDLQEDKEPLFDSVNTLTVSLELFAEMLDKTEFNSEVMLTASKTGFLNATDAADYLVEKGLTFREAHEIVGTLVAKAVEHSQALEDFELSELKTHSDLFEDDFYQRIALDNIIALRKSTGGTSKDAIQAQLKQIAELTKSSTRNLKHLKSTADIKLEELLV